MSMCSKLYVIIASCINCHTAVLCDLTEVNRSNAKKMSQNLNRVLVLVMLLHAG